MVVGNGLIASAFSSFQKSDDVIIFASGVSNSSEIAAEAFDRESRLLKQHLQQQKLLVYFSTLSVFDQSLKQSHYVKHKLAMENLIRSGNGPHIIFRLPIMIGKSSNPNTLINYLANSIDSGTHFKLYGQACRYLMTVSDLNTLLSPLIQDVKFHSQTLNVATSKRLSVLEIVEGLEVVLNRKASFEAVEKGDCYDGQISENVIKHPAFKYRTLNEMLTEAFGNDN